MECQDQVSRYYEKFKFKFNGKSTMYVKQLIFILNTLRKYFDDEKVSDRMLKVNEFVDISGLEAFNLLKLEQFLVESKIANKVS